MQELVAFLKSRQPVNLLMVLANIAVFLVLSCLGDTEDARFMAAHGASVAALVRQGEYYRLFTCMFLHFGLDHLMYNMLVLVFLGDTLEKVAGKLRYLAVYLIGGVAGNIVSVLVGLNKDAYVVSAGASGAVFSVIGALVFLAVKFRGDVEELSGKRLILMAVLSIAQGLTAQGIDNSAHIGGFAAGFLLAFLLNTGGKRNRSHKGYCSRVPREQ